MTSPTINTPSQLSRPHRILVAQDKPGIPDYLQVALRSPGFVVEFTTNGEELLSALVSGGETPALVVLDIAVPHQDKIAILKKLRHQSRTLPVIVLSGAASEENREEAIENGASDFLTKPVSHEELRHAVDGLLRSATQPVSARPIVRSAGPDLNLRAGSWIRRIEPLLNRFAAADVPVLLQGETGVGKEILARHIHNQSDRSGKIFLKLNCAALPSELVESELFGYERGAFTGAFKSTPGKFELANGGTILLDEIGDMDHRLQAKLLQVLQDREFHRIGAKESTQVDTRVIAATHRELETLIARGEFREDLYYRLNVVNIVIPPLRERLDEIIPLASSFLRKHNTGESPVPEIGPALRTALLRHQWPGNVRELENVMRRYLVVRSSEVIVDELQMLASRATYRDRFSASNVANGTHSRWASDLKPGGPELYSKPITVRSTDQASMIAPMSGQYSLDRPDGENSELAKLDQVRQAAETEVIMKTLHLTQWNRKRAATLLGVDYKALLYKMKKLGIE